MSESFDSAYRFAQLESFDEAIEDIQALEKKLSEMYGSPITLIAFAAENDAVPQT